MTREIWSPYGPRPGVLPLAGSSFRKAHRRPRCGRCRPNRAFRRLQRRQICQALFDGRFGRDHQGRGGGRVGRVFFDGRRFAGRRLGD